MAITNCKKNPDIDIEPFEITSENVSVQNNTAILTGAFSFSGNVEGITVLVSENESLTPSSSFAAKVDPKNKTFSATLMDLKHATTYYYCYSVDLGATNPYRTEAKAFSTTGNAPTVVILETVSLDCTTYRIKCEVVSDGGQEVTERGICWSAFGVPSLNNETAQHDAGGTGQYNIRMEDLAMGTKYYVRAYAKNSVGVSYSDTKQFLTCTETTHPTVSTVEISDITYHSVVCHGDVISNGGLPLTERGVCWGVEPDPTINVHAVIAEGTAIGPYTVTIDGLAPNTTYHARCYATNEKGTAYGETLTFITTQGEPTVITLNVTSITAYTAKSGGNVTNEGVSSVIERGICWSDKENPTIADNHNHSGTGEGVFEIVMSGLNPGITYHVRAYAKNQEYLSYGSDIEFTTSVTTPAVTTDQVFDITQTSAKLQGTLTNNGGAPDTEKGFCWNTVGNPNINDNRISCGTGTGTYLASMNNLTPGTKYYVKAYATNSTGTGYGIVKSFTTPSSGSTPPTGAIDALYSVGPNTQVYFSRGNLQYNGSTNKWQFAEVQWDVVGTAQGNTASTIRRDLFGWGTSGFNHGAALFQPWSVSTNDSDYYAYGNSSLNLYDSNGKADWGYNQIDNGGNQTNSGWRTLTANEWIYVFNTRYTASGIRYAKARVNNVNGVILLPDNWSASYFTLSNVNIPDATFSSNTITSDIWNTYLKNHGAVFLPAAGLREGTTIDNIDYFGLYWSASANGNNNAGCMLFNDETIDSNKALQRHSGASVRLVRNSAQ